jgi:hypothetical protein
MGLIRWSIFLFFVWCSFLSVIPRSVHRPYDPHMPALEIFWTDNPNEPHYTLKNRCLRKWALFDLYDPEKLQEDMLPETISYRYEPEKKVTNKRLSFLIQQFLDELLSTRQKKLENYKNFTILKDRNYNYNLRSGLIIIKFNEYPFVVKLFIENPKSFVQPFIKGFEPCWFFLMAGGMNRYLAGFTRIPNLHKVKEKISADPYWANRVTFPRKWYWLPKKSRQFTVIGYNFENNTTLSQTYPSIYGIICDEIQLKRQMHNYFKQDRLAIREIMDFLGNHLDPHIYNFFIEKDTEKIAIIDTELFSAMVGLHEEFVYTKNTKWYGKLADKCSKDCFFRTKKEHRDMIASGLKPILVE